jgi:hypothetical protein
MAFDDTKCPCGDKKPAGTMLCEPCEAYLSDRREIREYLDTSLNVELRQHAAVTLLTLARGRKLARRGV